MIRRLSDDEHEKLWRITICLSMAVKNVLLLIQRGMMTQLFQITQVYKLDS